MAAGLAGGPRVAIKLTKKLLNQSFSYKLEETMEMEAFAQSLCLQTEDHKEGVQAFLDKRKPNFKGR